MTEMPPALQSLLLLNAAVILMTCGFCAATNRSFGISDDQFQMDGQPFQVISGSIHYSRVPPQYWGDRLMRLREMGLNAIQTYVPWNFHEPEQGKHDFTGWRNISAFLQEAQDKDLVVLLRPGPYICAEWDFGGLPAWLMAEPAMQLRSSDPAYLKHVDAWWTRLFDEVADLTYSRGGPIVAVQIENEYGYYGRKDPDYLRHLAKLAREKLGQDMLLYTTDGAYPWVVGDGTLPGDEVLTVVDFGPGTDIKAAFELQRQYNAPGKSPPFCSEFYSGWLTHWGERMANTSTQQMGHTLADILAYANGTGSVNLYMGHGGTNFGFWAGANIVPAVSSCGGSTTVPSARSAWGMKYGSTSTSEQQAGRCGAAGNKLDYRPHITSYDYDCPVGEAGTSGQLGIGGESKLGMVQDVIERHKKSKGETLPERKALPEPELAAYGTIKLDESVTLLDVLHDLVPRGGPVDTLWPQPMEDYNQSFGLIMYETEISQDAGTLEFTAHDYAKVMLDGKLIASWWRNSPEPVQLPGSQRANLPGRVLQILVEAMGRDNFGSDFGEDRKGLLGNVTLNGQPVSTWHVYSLPLDSPSWHDRASLGRGRQSGGGASSASRRLAFVAPRKQQGQRPAASAPSPPTLHRGTLDIPKAADARDPHPRDTFLRMDGWGKGYVWVNGNNLGRYWQPKGPQLTLYLPGCWLSHGSNEVVVLELDEAPGEPAVESVDAPDFTAGTLDPRWGVV